MSGQQAGSERQPPRLGWRIKVAAGLALIAALCGHALLGVPAAWASPPRLPAQVLAVAGGLLTLWHYRFLSAARATGRAGQLVTRGGLFYCVRHPMYLGDCLLYLGLFLLAPHPVTALIAAVGIAALVAQSRAEDAYMAGLFPDEFAAWHARSGLLLPRLRRQTDV